MGSPFNVSFHKPNPVALVFGTRPEAIKLAPVAWALKRADIPFKIYVTAQHRELLDQMLSVFSLKADVDLDLMKPDQALTDFGGRALSRLGELFRKESPSMVIVQGDTSTVFFAALAAFYEQIPVGHVEAGLRSDNMRHPFPEEANRSLTGRLATVHFAPTQRARVNLSGEGIKDESIFLTGNTVVDALQYMVSQVDSLELSGTVREIIEDLNGRKLVLLTAHRRENFGTPMEDIFGAVADLTGKRDDLCVVYPVHPNPNVQKMAHNCFDENSRVTLVDPLSYTDFVALMKHASLCLTDSGGVQEEAPGLGIPVIVLRETTERPEGVEAGCSFLAGSNRTLIVEKAMEFLDKGKLPESICPYGDGTAGDKIAAIVGDYLSGSF